MMKPETKGMKIFAGNAGRDLASGVAKALGLELGKTEVSSFSDGETSISILETVRGYDVFLVQSTCEPVNDRLMELLIMIDACKRASARHITAVVPYFGYARQDRKAKPRDPISAKLVADLLTSAGANRVMSMDLHALQIQGFFNIPVDHLLGAPVFLDYYKKRFEGKMQDLVIVSPDVGSVSRVRKFAKHLETPIAIVDKRRQKANMCEVMSIIGNVEGKNVLIVDDMVDTGGTLCKSAEAIRNIGGAKDVFACATHGVLSGQSVDAIEKSVISEMMFLDTIPIPSEKRGSKIKVLSAVSLFTDVMHRVFLNEPVSQLFV